MDEAENQVVFREFAHACCSPATASAGAGNLKARFENMARASDEENRKRADEEKARRQAREKRSEAQRLFRRPKHPAKIPATVPLYI